MEEYGRREGEGKVERLLRVYRGGGRVAGSQTRDS